MRRAEFDWERHLPKLAFCSVVPPLNGAELGPVQQVEGLPAEVQVL